MVDQKKLPLFHVYVLELEESKFYIGKSDQPISRLGEHTITNSTCGGGRGARWTQMYRPIKIIEIIKAYDEFDEDINTLRYMKRKGIDNVRGGSFCELNLSYENITTLEKMLAGACDKCYFCGEDDHYIASCPQKQEKRKLSKGKKAKMVKKSDIPKSRIMKYYGVTKLFENSDIKIKDNNGLKSSESIKNTKLFYCRYCKKGSDSVIKRKKHEDIFCLKNDKLKKLDSDVDAILKSNGY